jgi:hypothetical protein
LHGVGGDDKYADAYQFYEGLRDVPPGTYSIPLDARASLIRSSIADLPDA